jgi:hypothetical protein
MGVPTFSHTKCKYVYIICISNIHVFQHVMKEGMESTAPKFALRTVLTFVTILTDPARAPLDGQGPPTVVKVCRK